MADRTKKRGAGMNHGGEDSKVRLGGRVTGRIKSTE